MATVLTSVPAGILWSSSAWSAGRAGSKRIAAAKARLQRTNPVDDQAAYNKMFGDLVALEQRRKWLLDRATGA